MSRLLHPKDAAIARRLGCTEEQYIHELFEVLGLRHSYTPAGRRLKWDKDKFVDDGWIEDK